MQVYVRLKMLYNHRNTCTIMYVSPTDPITVSIVTPITNPVEWRLPGSDFVFFRCRWNSTAYYMGWYKDDNLVYAIDLVSNTVIMDTLSAVSSYSSRYSLLSIPRTSLADSGNYTCVVGCEARDVALDDIPEALKDSKKLCLYGEPYC